MYVDKEIEMKTKVCCKCKEVKTLDGFSKQRASKDGYQSKCKACEKVYQVEYRAANPEKRKESNAKWCAANPDYHTEYRAANPEKKKESNAKWCAANPEKKKESHAKYYAANSEKEKERHAANPEKNKEYQAKWAKANPEKGRAKESNRRAAKLEAIPKWLTKAEYKAMEDINKEAKRLTKETGIKHEVDHIHPLQGKLICGLQCPTNLQILTKSENCSKGNRFTPYVESA